MKPINAYQTSDGTLFAKKEHAEKHELFLKKQDVVEEFLDSEHNPYTGSAQKSIARKTIINWELWKAKNDKNLPE